MLLARVPGALYFGAPLLREPVPAALGGAFYARADRHWAWAGACAARRAATRSAGIVLLLPLALLWWSSRDRAAPPRRAPGSCSRPLGTGRLRRSTWRWRRATPCASCTCRRRGPRHSPGRSGRLGRPRGGGGRRAPARVRASARPCTSSRPAATRSGSAAHQPRCCSASCVFAVVAAVGRVAAAAARPTAPTWWPRSRCPLLVPGRAAAADVAAALPRGAVPGLHVARARVRGAPRHRARARRCPPRPRRCSRPQYATWHWIA